MEFSVETVSYTHLDVYKRQSVSSSISSRVNQSPISVFPFQFLRGLCAVQQEIQHQGIEGLPVPSSHEVVPGQDGQLAVRDGGCLLYTSHVGQNRQHGGQSDLSISRHVVDDQNILVLLHGPFLLFSSFCFPGFPVTAGPPSPRNQRCRRRGGAFPALSARGKRPAHGPGAVSYTHLPGARILRADSKIRQKAAPIHGAAFEAQSHLSRPNFLLKRLTRPPVSTIFCLPV